MVELIALIVLICSLVGIAVILWKKVPVLVELPEVVEKTDKKNLSSALFFAARERIKTIFPRQIVLHRILCWIKILTLKIETKIDKLLHIVRKKAQKEKEEKENGNKIVQETQPTQTKALEQKDTNSPAGGPPTLPPSMPV